ncbi:MAG: hydrogenase 4 subunit B [Candidatus Rokubacteria bacterium]|nr:hydrogenase 4 subunit B [Candidatus Rokubacteria bacterium]
MSRVAYSVAAALGALAAMIGISGLLGDTWVVTVPWAVPLGGLQLSMDRLAGFFVALIGFATIPVSLYAIGYAGDDRRGALPYVGFVIAMCAVPLAANVMTFAVAWELMALASYLLVVQKATNGTATHPGAPAADGSESHDASPHAGGRHAHDAAEATGAAWTYAVMAHAGFVCLLAGMLLLSAWSGSTRFADWRDTELTPLARDAVFVLLALGFASKAGVIPLHVWLPLAHPAAPSHVSALMSGVMIKLGVYGLFRVSLEWIGPAPAWWGVAILVAGTISAVVGVLYALVEHDLKRLLAFHSIENVGIILIGLGAGVLFLESGLGTLAVLGIAAALYHTANHAAFKGLLFLGAGAVVRSTGTRNMEVMGGLVKRMPWTAAMFLLGAVAISALPPLNGFVSEWLTFQALLQSLQVPHTGIGLVFVGGMAGLALTGGLAMACFVKAFGVTFLALPRSEAARSAVEAPGWMRLGMALLAFACVALGLGPTIVVPVLGLVAGDLTGEVTPLWFGDWLRLDVPGDFASLSTFAIAIALLVAGIVPLVVLRARGLTRRRVYETWGCGRLLQTSRMQYTATAFASPFRRIFDFLYQPAHALHVEAHPESRFFVDAIRYVHETRAVAEDWLYHPLSQALHDVTERIRGVQSGSTNVYLVYILAALVLMLVLG